MCLTDTHAEFPLQFSPERVWDMAVLLQLIVALQSCIKGLDGKPGWGSSAQNPKPESDHMESLKTDRMRHKANIKWLLNVLALSYLSDLLTDHHRVRVLSSAIRAIISWSKH